MQQSFSITGRVKVAVIDHNGNTILERPWQKNLLLDQGCNKLAIKSWAEIFEVAAKGTDTATATKEVPHATNTYSLTGATITRNTSPGTPRDFTSGDVGKLLRNVDGQECVIVTYTDATHVDVRAVGSGALVNYANKTATFYHVQQVGLVAESGDRTSVYSSIAGENSTVDGTGSDKNKRTLKRTFVFSQEPANIESAGGVYSWAGTTVTRNSGARNFVAGDVGKYFVFSPTSYGKIVSITSVSIAEVDRTGTEINTISPSFYGFRTYGEIGFSDDETAGNNINIRVRLEDGGGAPNPVVLLAANPETPGQQLKVTYETTITLTPDVITGSTPAAIIDPGNVMSSNKNFTSVIESLAISRINPDGQTNLDYAGLEPSQLANLGLSTVFVALVSFGNTDRTAGEFSKEMTADDYEVDSFVSIHRGTLELNEGIGTTWRSIGLVDPDSNNYLFTCLFAGNQRKDGEHSITIAFAKAWNRDLS